ncbi:MAG: hypothetical protein ACLPVF_02225 [Acidimicrobiales bacterium]
MDLILRKILRTGIRHGMADQNWTWFVIVGCALVLRRSLKDRGSMVSSFKIAPGEQILISVRDGSTQDSAAQLDEA